MEYWLAFAFAILGGVLLGIFGTTVYYTFWHEEDFDEDEWWK